MYEKRDKETTDLEKEKRVRDHKKGKDKKCPACKVSVENCICQTMD